MNIKMVNIIKKVSFINNEKIKNSEIKDMTRRDLVEKDIKESKLNKSFIENVYNADLARDSGDYIQSEYLYWKIIQDYPFHHGYIIQYAHSLKENKKYIDSEVYYRSALSLGAKPEDVVEHLNFVIKKQGLDLFYQENNNIGDLLKDYPPSLLDIKSFSMLFRQTHEISIVECAEIMRKCNTLDEVCEFFIENFRFREKNSSFLKIVKNNI